MGETSVSEGILALFEGPYRLWVVIAVMSILGSLASAFTFCVKRKRADDAISRRKKTDESAPDDHRVVSSDSDRQGDTRLPTASSTSDEQRLHNTEVAGENGIHPVITEVNKQDETANNLSDHQEGVVPPIKEMREEEKGDSETEGEGDVPEIEVKEDAPLITVTAVEGEGETEDVIEEVREREGNMMPSEPEEDLTNSVSQPLVNGISDDHAPQEELEVDGEVAMTTNALEEGRWNFPPKLEDFDLMETDIDPSELELIFADERLVEIYLELESDGPGLGISIVGGSGSPSGGDLPIIIKRVLPNSLAEQDGRLKSGDELVAVNDTLLVAVPKDVAIETLSHVSGRFRLLVLQDD